MNFVQKNKVSFFIAKVLQRIPHIDRVGVLYNQRRHKKMEEELSFLFDKVSNENDSDLKSVYISEDTDSKIWFFWWQGVENMPTLVRKCYQSVLKNKGSREVCIITKDNYQEYTDFPAEELDKLASGRITLTHFSDLLRFNLLKNHGGLWLDATMYITGSLDQVSLNNGIFTNSGYSTNRLFNVSGGRWTGFMIGGPQNNALFTFMDTFFKEYWSNYDFLIDYFLIDYALNYAYRYNLGGFKKASEDFKGVNPCLFKLQPIINCEFNKNNWIKLTQNTYAFKLSNREKLISSKDSYFYNI